MSGFDLVTANAPLLLAGCGKMGAALLKGWLGRGLDPRAVYIIDPEFIAVRAEFTALSLETAPLSLAFAPLSLAPECIVATAADLPARLKPAVIVLAVKPQIMDAALKPLGPYVKAGSAVISIAAGKTIKYFTEKLGEDAALIRAMPNTPAAIGHGMTVAFANENVSPVQKDLCSAMMTSVGQFAWLEEEHLIDAVTAVSGSGPAYVFYLAECLAAAGKAAGLSNELAQLLAVETVVGAGALLAASGEAPHDLRRHVTSPKGTTEAALDILMAPDGMADLLRKAVTAAARRSRELAGDGAK